jgi:hypothetical protein
VAVITWAYLYFKRPDPRSATFLWPLSIDVMLFFMVAVYLTDF